MTDITFEENKDFVILSKSANLTKCNGQLDSITNYPSSSEEAVESPCDFWTREKLIDELVFCLCSINYYRIDKDTKEIYIRHKYYDQAEWLIYRVNVWKPIPEFIIDKSDLTFRLKKEISHLRSTPTVLNKIMTDAVRGILEARYYHLSGIYGKIRWRLVP